MAATAIAAGCSKDIAEELPTGEVKLGSHALYATTSGDTRTYLNDAQDNLLWSENDAIAVMALDATDVYKYVIQEGVGTTEATFWNLASQTGVPDNARIRAFYPYDCYHNGLMEIPATQHYVEKGIETNLSPMCAESLDDQVNTLRFRHMAGVVSVEFYSNASIQYDRTVKQIKLVSTQDNLAGIGAISYLPDGRQYVDLTSVKAHNTTKEIVLDCTSEANPDGIALPTTEGQSVQFMFIVPADTYKAGTLSFEIVDQNGSVKKTVSKDLVVARGAIMKFPVAAIDGVVKAETAEKVEDAITSALPQDDTDTAPIYVQVQGKLQGTAAAPATVTIPTAFDTDAKKTIPLTIDLPKATEGSVVKIQAATEGTATDVPTHLNIVTDSETAKALVIDLPNTTVTVNGKYAEVNATTAANTLIVSEGAVIEKLTITQGSAEIRGLVNQIVKGEQAGQIKWYISTPEALQSIAAIINAGGEKEKFFEGDYFELTQDIDMKYSPYVPMGSDASYSTTASAPGFAGTFDGKNYTIRNLNISGNDFKNNRSVGLFGTIYGATIQNITLDGVTIAYASKWAGGLVGDMQGGTLKNCHVTNAKLCTKPDPKEGYTFAFRLGGLVGICRATCEITDCSVNGATIDGYYSMGGLVGACNVNDCKMTINNCLVDNLVLNHRIAGGYQNKYYDSAVLLGDCDPAKQITLTDITLGKWEIKGAIKATETTKGWTDQTWTMFPYLGEKPSTAGIVPTLDNKALQVTPLSETMFTSEAYNTVAAWDGVSLRAIVPVGNNYGIYDAAELAWVAQQVNDKTADFAGKTLTLYRDIDLGSKSWQPIGSNDVHSITVSSTTGIPAFCGTFEGNGKTVRNISVNKVADAKGFFGRVGDGGIVRNLTIEQVAIPAADADVQDKAGKWVGGLAGTIDNNVTLESCTAKNVTIDAPGMYRIGGLVGFWNNGGTKTTTTLSKCAVDGASLRAGYGIGGLIGTMQAPSKTLSGCSVNGIEIAHKDQYCWKNDPNYSTYAAATGGYVFASSAFVGDACAFTMSNITVGTWKISNEDTYTADYTKADWTYLPYVGEMSGGTKLGDTVLKKDSAPAAQLGTQYTGEDNRK